MVILDNTALAALSACETKAAVLYGLNVRPAVATGEDAAKLAGQAVHAGVAHVARGGTVEEAMRVIEVMYRKFAEREVPQTERRFLWPNVEKCARSYFDQRPLESMPFEVVPELVEVPFAVQVNEGLWLTGLFDGIVRDKVDKRYYVREVKTTGQKSDWWMKQWRMASQVSHYTWCAPRAQQVKDVLGDITIAGCFIDKIDMSLLPSDPKRKCQGKDGHGTTYDECGPLHAQHMVQRFDRSQSELHAWEESVYHLAARWTVLTEAVDGKPDNIKYASQEGMFNGECKFCELQNFCATGRQRWAMMEERKWGPVQPEALVVQA